MIEPNKMTKDQLKVLALKQRIGILTSEYEDQIADMRADFTQQLGNMQDALREQEEQIEGLLAQLRKTDETLHEEDESDNTSH